MADAFGRKPFGGEPAACAYDHTFSYLTDSGRSSIRLILRSGFERKRFLLPDFVCDAVPRVFDELGIAYAFYRVREDLTIDPVSLAGRSFDVLYIVDYFGQRQRYDALVDEQIWIVEDCVFSPVVERPPGRKRWIGFNSFRKISPLTDGSLVRSTVALDEHLIAKAEAPFVALKTSAKRAKREYLDGRSDDEAPHLQQFAQAEAMLDAQEAIHSMSRAASFQLLDLYRALGLERRVRRRNLAELARVLHRWALPLKPAHPCVCVLSVDRRDELRAYLRERRIFLPVHWPNPRGLDNPLYRKIISIPLDSRYGRADMRRVAEAITDFQRRA
jgi:hypothetical protein